MRVPPAIKIALLFSIILLFAINVKEAESSTFVSGIRHWSNPDYTRVVVHLSEPAAFSYRLLKKDPDLGKPRRLYIDIDGALLGKDLERSIPINDGLLIEARAGQNTKQTVRIVLDIESIEDYRVFPLNDPFRIVIDVSGEKKEGAAKNRPLSKAPVPPGEGRAMKIVIDPGHGGKDPGAIGKKGLKEKDVTLEIGHILRDILLKKTGADVVMTRTNDTFIPLEERTAIANKLNADLFISIHVNASPRKGASGIETYILNVSNDSDSRRVAARENATSEKSLSDLEFILLDLIKTAKTNDSIVLANLVQENLVGRLKSAYTGVSGNGVRGAPFYVLVGTRMPAVLAEVSYISNAQEEKRLRSHRYLKEIAEGISAGVLKFLKGGEPI